MNAQIGNLFTFTRLRMWVKSGLVSNNVRGNSWCIFFYMDYWLHIEVVNIQNMDQTQK